MCGRKRRWSLPGGKKNKKRGPGRPRKDETADSAAAEHEEEERPPSNKKRKMEPAPEPQPSAVEASEAVPHTSRSSSPIGDVAKEAAAAVAPAASVEHTPAASAADDPTTRAAGNCTIVAGALEGFEDYLARE